MDYRFVNSKPPLPRGIRNNNPGNLIITTEKWQRKIPKKDNTDGRFEQFETIIWGSRAMIIDISNDIKKGQDTIEKLISAYSPRNENQTDKYITFVSETTGIPSNQKLSANKETLSKLFKAILIKENGIKDFKTFDVNSWFTQAYDLAFKKKSRLILFGF